MAGVRLGVGGPCPPIRNDIVTPRHLLRAVSVLQNEPKLRSSAQSEWSILLFLKRSIDFERLFLLKKLS